MSEDDPRHLPDPDAARSDPGAAQASPASSDTVRYATRRRGGVFRRGLRTFGYTLLAPLAFLAVAGFLMLGHEVTAPTWVKDRVEAEADKLLAGGAIAFGDIKVTVGRDLHPAVQLRNTTLTDAAGRIIARVPQIEAIISPRGLILRQELLVQTVDLTGAQISIRRNVDGSVAVAFDTAGEAVGQAPSFAELLDQIDQSFERPALEALERVQAEGLVVSYNDARAGRSWTVDGGSLSLSLTNGETRLESHLSLLSGRDYVTTADLDYRSPRGNREAKIDLQVIDMPAADIASQVPALSWLSDLDAKLAAGLSANIKPDGTLGLFTADLTIGAGFVTPAVGAKPLPFRSAEARLTYDPIKADITFENVSALTDWGGFAGAGRARLQGLQNGWPTAIVSQLTFSDLSFNPRNLYDDPVILKNGVVDAKFQIKPFVLQVGQFRVAVGDDILAGSGQASADEAGWHAALDLDADRLTLPALMSLWPETTLPGTRKWLDTNLDGGTLLDLTGGLRIEPGQRPRYALTWNYAIDHARFMATLPPIDGARGFGTLQDNSLTLRVDQGDVAAPQGGRVNVAGSTFRIPTLGLSPARAEIELATQSTVTAALAILDLPPFGYMTRAGLPVTIAEGSARAQGTVRLPLKPTALGPGEVFFDFAAQVSDFRSAALVPGKTLTAPSLAVTANLDSGLRIEGPVRVGQVSARGSWSRALGPGAPSASKVEADVAIGQAFLDEFNIRLPQGSVRGEGAGRLQIDLVSGAAPGFSLRSNLQGIGLSLPAVGWSKAAGASGTLEVEGRLGSPPDISRLLLEADGLSASGTLDVLAQGGLDKAQFSRVRIGNWFDAPVTLTGRGANRAAALDIRGGSLDLRRATLGDSGGQGGPMTIALDRLQISEGIALTGFEGAFDASGGFSGNFTANLNEGTSVRGAVVPSGGRSAVRLVGDDAGGAFRSIGLIRNANGGSLDLTLVPTGAEGNYDGTLAVTDLRVKDAPALAGLLDAISVVGLFQQMDGQGLSFNNVDAQFRITPDQLIVTQSSAVGPGLGISLDGTYTLASKNMEFQGVVSPLYLLNGIGSILTRPGEGLIGFNYTLRGPLDEMRVGVNPLSVLTPGMFRNIFRRPPPQVN